MCRFRLRSKSSSVHPGCPSSFMAYIASNPAWMCLCLESELCEFGCTLGDAILCIGFTGRQTFSARNVSSILSVPVSSTEAKSLRSSISPYCTTRRARLPAHVGLCHHPPVNWKVGFTSLRAMPCIARVCIQCQGDAVGVGFEGLHREQPSVRGAEVLSDVEVKTSWRAAGIGFRGGWEQQISCPHHREPRR